MFSKKELKIINNALIIIYLLSVGPTFIFGFTKSNDFTSTFFLIANIILVCLFIIIAIRRDCKIVCVRMNDSLNLFL